MLPGISRKVCLRNSLTSSICNPVRYLPIWIGNAEADAIGIKLQGIQCPRPLTHDFLCTVIEALGATVKSAVINKLQDNTFHAKVALVTDKG